MINVVCVKWGDKYGPEYVNILRAMVKRNLSLPHRFVCFTDDTTGLHSDIETIPLEEDLKGWWHKITLFKPDIGGLSGRMLFMDLDVVILSSLDEMATYETNFAIIEEWHAPGSRRYNSSVFMMDVGSHSNVWTEFDRNRDLALKRNLGDQDWITKQIIKADIWPQGWVKSFKWSYQKKEDLREGTKILVFHGRPNPHEAIPGMARWQPQPWLADYWRE